VRLQKPNHQPAGRSGDARRLRLDSVPAKTNVPFGHTALLAAGRANVLPAPMRPCERPVSL